MEVFFERPDAGNTRHPGRTELGSLFNPYWQARLAPVSGFVLSTSGQPTLYIAGDTVWCPVVAGAIDTHAPDIIVVNAGAAQFLEGGVITMDVDDVVQVCRAAPRGPPAGGGPGGPGRGRGRRGTAPRRRGWSASATCSSAASAR